MSSTTDVMIAIPSLKTSEEVIGMLSPIIRHHSSGDIEPTWNFTHIDKSKIGGKKGFESDLYLVGINYLDRNYLADFIQLIPERHPDIIYEAITVFLRHESFDTWTVASFNNIDSIRVK